jgi:branched-chain amino acid transport system substrate-binding protein
VLAVGAAAGGAASPSPITKADVAWGVKYTNGHAGKANSKLSPVGIQYINQQGGSLSFPKVTDAANVAVKFINNYLGGIKGHPLKLQPCFVQAEEDGQKCGTQLVNSGALKAGVLGTVAVGNQSLYGTVKGRKPLFVSAPATGPDLTSTPNVYAYSPGGVALISGMAVMTGKILKPQTVSLVITDNDIGHFIGPLYSTKLASILPSAKVTSVFVSPTATEPQITSALQAAGAQNSDVIAMILVSTTCDAAAHALNTLGIHKPVVASAGCFSPEIMPKGDKLRSGWYFGDWGTIPYVKEAKYGTSTYVDVMQAAKLGNGASDGQDRIFSTIMTVAKFLNQVGPAGKASAINAKVKAFHGPAMMVPGPIACGAQTGTPALCSTWVGVAHYVNGRWSTVATFDPSKG